jgi:exonuclease III
MEGVAKAPPRQRMTDELRLISWNVNARRGIVAQQADAVGERDPHLVALQEVRRETVEEWERKLAAAGLRHFISTGELVGDRHNFVAVASRFPLEWSGAEIDVPFEELVLPVLVRVVGRPVELIATHVPNGSTYGWKKVEHFEAVYRYLADAGEPARILCGDFNSPLREFNDGRVYTAAQHESGALRLERGERWDKAERDVLLGLGRFGLVDVFRQLHGYGKKEGSWAPREARGPIQRRFDHVFADVALNPRRCCYIHAWRMERPALSDHSAIEAVLEPRPR